jgi:hypothetical protein
VFWTTVALGPVAGLAWSSTTDDSVIFTVIVATLAAIAGAGWCVRPRSVPGGSVPGGSVPGRSVPAELHDSRLHQVRDAVAETEPRGGQRAP